MAVQGLARNRSAKRTATQSSLVYLGLKPRVAAQCRSRRREMIDYEAEYASETPDERCDVL